LRHSGSIVPDNDTPCEEAMRKLRLIARAALILLGGLSAVLPIFDELGLPED
jgi:hypothetical protein